MRGMNFSQLLSGARPRTLALSVAPVWIGAAAAWRLVTDRSDHVAACTPLHLTTQCVPSAGCMIFLALLCLGVALFLQIAANFCNDYSDGIRGTDAHRSVQYQQSMEEVDQPLTYEQLHAPTRLVASGVPARLVLRAGVMSAIIAGICGILVTIITGQWWFIALGAVCMLAAWFYVGGSHPYGYSGWGELAAFLFFGPVATLGTTYAIAGEVSVRVIIASILMGLISFAVLSVNNIRDIHDDSHANKRTWAVRLGATPVMIMVTIGVWLVALATLFAWWQLITQGPTYTSVGLSFCAILGTVCTLMFAVVTTRDVWKHEYMRTMRSLSLLACSFAIAASGFLMIL